MNKIQQFKNNGLITFMFIFLCQSLLSQEIEKLYVNMPDVLNPTLSRQNRLELIEYHKAHQSDSTANRFGNQAHLILMDAVNQHIVVKNTLNSTFDMKLLTLEDSTLAIGIIRTVCAPICQSSVEFYDTAWSKVPMQFTLPKAIEWFDLKSFPAEGLDLSWVKNLMNVSFVSLSFSSDNLQIKAMNNTLFFLSEADRKTIQSYIKEKPIIFQLRNRQWEQQL
jgi:hypothetical protein